MINLRALIIALALTVLAAAVIVFALAQNGHGLTVRSAIVASVFALGAMVAAVLVAHLRRRFHAAASPLISAALFMALGAVIGSGLFFIVSLARHPAPLAWPVSAENLDGLFHGLLASTAIYWLFGIHPLWPWGVMVLFLGAWGLWRLDNVRDH